MNDEFPELPEVRCHSCLLWTDLTPHDDVVVRRYRHSPWLDEFDWICRVCGNRWFVFFLEFDQERLFVDTEELISRFHLETRAYVEILARTNAEVRARYSRAFGVESPRQATKIEFTVRHFSGLLDGLVDAYHFRALT